MKCNEEGCDQLAAYSFTWPGQREAGICNGHPERTAAIIAAMVPLRPAIQTVSADDAPAARGTGRKVVEVNCDNCGNIFTANVTDRKRGWARFCSKSCKAIKQEQRRKANENKN